MTITMYFVVTVQWNVIDGIKDATGLIYITLYEIIDGKMVKFNQLETGDYGDEKETIQVYLDDNGYGDDNYELIQL